MASDEPIRVVLDAETGTTQLLLHGRVTVGCASQFHATALKLAAGDTDVTVSCETAEFLDVSALQILLCLGRDLMSRGRRCDITGVTGSLGDDFRLAGLGSAPAKS